MYNRRAIRNRITFYQDQIIGKMPSKRRQISENAEIKRIQESLPQPSEDPGEEAEVDRKDIEIRRMGETVRRLQQQVATLRGRPPPSRSATRSRSASDLSLIHISEPTRPY